MEIIQLTLKEIKQYSRNAKLHPKEQVEQIKKSILQFGMNDPIAIWSDENIIVEGHGRYLAIKSMSKEEKIKCNLNKTLPCFKLDHLTDEERKAYTLTHNKTTMNSDFDIELLGSELDEIIDIDMSDFGFDLDTFEEEQEIIEDEPPEVDEESEPIAKLGDIWQLGKHRLVCGDSCNIETVEKLMDGVKADIYLSDPPYGISIVTNKKVGGSAVTHFGTIEGEKIVKATTYSEIIGDDTIETAEKSTKLAFEFSENQIIFGGNYFTDFLEPTPCWCIWDKENTGNFADVEMAWTSFSKGAKLYKWLWNGMSRKGERKIEGKTRVHPTQKPVGMLVEILKDFSKEKNIVLDLFGGSGSTLIACEQTNRICKMVELSEKYVDVILKRFYNLTNEEPTLNGIKMSQIER